MTDIRAIASPSIGDRVKAWREQRGMTCRELGAAIGLSAGKVSEIETGKYWPGVKPALALERLSAGAVDAGDLNEDVRASRHGLTVTAHPAPLSPGKGCDPSRADDGGEAGQ